MVALAKTASANPPLAIDLFSGCGGLTAGLKTSGFNVLAAVELDRKAQDAYAMNHPDVHLYRGDIRDLDPSLAMRLLCLRPGELDLLAGCPPCQGFSRLRTKNRLGCIDDERNDLIGEFERYAAVLRPKTVMLENVPALAADGRFARLTRSLRRMGYAVASAVLDAADYGVPQRRRRLILLASRIHVPRIVAPSGRRQTVRDVLGQLPKPSMSADRLHAFPEKRSMAVRRLIARIPKDGGSRGDLGAKHQLACHAKSNGFYDVYGRMAWDDVAPTITSGCHNPSKGRYLHPEQDRAITLREAALLQGFPPTYKFDVAHGKESIALMIGNALPPQFIAAHAHDLFDAAVSRTSRRDR